MNGERKRFEISGEGGGGRVVGAGSGVGWCQWRWRVVLKGRVVMKVRDLE